MNRQSEKKKLPPIVLLSGTPLGGTPHGVARHGRKTSFTRQLDVLSCAFRRLGVEAFTGGVHSESAGTASVLRTEGRVILENASCAELVKILGAGACILLGYPDQFQAFAGKNSCSIPLFLWAQYSHPPRAEDLAEFIPVPLTKKTAEHLHLSGLRDFPTSVPHGVDTSNFYPLGKKERERLRSSGGLGRRFVVGAVGAHTMRKRFDLVLESFARLLVHKKDAFLIIKTDRLLSLEGFDLVSFAKSLGVQKSVRILTKERNGRGMRELYGQMDIYLNLSEWEGFCIPVIEAMACGVPVACTPAQGPGEIVPYRELMIARNEFREEGESVLFKASPDSAAAVLLEAAEKPDLLRRLGFEGMDAVKKSYDIKIVAREWMKLIEEFHSRIEIL